MLLVTLVHVLLARAIFKPRKVFSTIYFIEGIIEQKVFRKMQCTFACLLYASKSRTWIVFHRMQKSSAYLDIIRVCIKCYRWSQNPRHLERNLQGERNFSLICDERTTSKFCRSRQELRNSDVAVWVVCMYLSCYVERLQIEDRATWNPRILFALYVSRAQDIWIFSQCMASNDTH